jgi:hypothetical protein
VISHPLVVILNFGFRCRVSGVSTAVNLKSGQSNRNRDFDLEKFIKKRILNSKT